MEDTHLTYYKLLDGLDTSEKLSLASVLDLSFNDFVTARYLVDNKGFRNVCSLTEMKTINYEGITPVRMERTLPVTLRRLRADMVISLGGSFRFQPLYDVAYAIYGSLNLGGRLVIAAYPAIYDKQGRDILGILSNMSSIPVREKLGRWYNNLFNTMSNLFVNIRTEQVLADTTVSEIMSIFGTEGFFKYLFKESSEFDKFFSGLSQNEEYYFSWKIIKGLKV